MTDYLRLNSVADVSDFVALAIDAFGGDARGYVTFATRGQTVRIAVTPDCGDDGQSFDGQSFGLLTDVALFARRAGGRITYDGNAVIVAFGATETDGRN